MWFLVGTLSPSYRMTLFKFGPRVYAEHSTSDSPRVRRASDRLIPRDNFSNTEGPLLWVQCCFGLIAFSLTSLPVSLHFLSSPEPSPKFHISRHQWAADINIILGSLLNSWRQILVKRSELPHLENFCKIISQSSWNTNSSSKAKCQH